MPAASTGVRVSSDGQYIFATGVYKPRVRCYDVHHLSMKFERCIDAEVVDFNLLSEDYSKASMLFTPYPLYLHICIVVSDFFVVVVFSLPFFWLIGRWNSMLR